jgi:hypothetical protein
LIAPLQNIPRLIDNIDVIASMSFWFALIDGVRCRAARRFRDTSCDEGKISSASSEKFRLV